jgi:hypothetical protein
MNKIIKVFAAIWFIIISMLALETIALFILSKK